MEDNPSAPSVHEADNVIPFERGQSFTTTHPSYSSSQDDDELLKAANDKIAEWQANFNLPSLTQVQELFFLSICAGASAMARDKIVSAIIAAFGDQLGGKRALTSTWGELAKQCAAERVQSVRDRLANKIPAPLTLAEKRAQRDALWPNVRELAESPDLIDQVVKQVQAMGVVNERELITLNYIAATSRVMAHPLNPLIKGASSAGKSFITMQTLGLMPPECVNHLTTSSALSLVYDERPLAHTVLYINESNQIQSDEHSTFSMLLRSLCSEGRIVHQTSVEDPNSPTGRRVERIVREGPIALFITTTSELHPENETRMLPWYAGESREQTGAVIAKLAAQAAGDVAAHGSLDVLHDLQRWIALGPDDAIIPFAHFARAIEPLMVRFRRDVGALFTFIKASALLHQAQRQVDAQGRVVATVADYELAHPIFSRVMAHSSGKKVPDNVREVVKLIAERSSSTATRPTQGRFQRIEATGAGEVVISSEQIGNAIGIGKPAAYRAVLAALEHGFLTNNEIRTGKPFRLVLKQGVWGCPLASRSKDHHHGRCRVILTAMVLNCFGQHRAVSTRCETVKLLTIKTKPLAVSPFHRFEEHCQRNSNRVQRPPTKIRGQPSQNYETAKRRGLYPPTSMGCLFRPTAPHSG
jgi:hypothetical protein